MKTNKVAGMCPFTGLCQTPWKSAYIEAALYFGKLYFTTYIVAKY
jgi:hypothetical protein